MAFRITGWRVPALLTALLAGTACAPAAAAAAPIETIVQDDALMLHGGEEQIRIGLQRTRELGIDRVRLTAGWSEIAPSPDSADAPQFDATDPAAYPADKWHNLDRAVRLAHEAGVAPMIDIAFWAPRWATQEPGDASGRLAREIDPRRYADFARAVARRYSGTWSVPVAPAAGPAPAAPPKSTLLDGILRGGRPTPTPQPEPVKPVVSAPLPAVDTFTIWNEPNHPGFLKPQWVKVGDRWVVRSAEIYREMVRAAYPAIKAAAPASRVLIGGTASMGSSTPGRSGVPPLRFLRELACVDGELRPIRTGSCANFVRLPGDGWSHHPYSMRTTPDVDPADKDKLPVGATRRLAATLSALADAGRVDSKVAHLYMTEYGYETNLPDPTAPFSLNDQARLLAWAEYLATREPSVRSWPQFQLYDRPDVAPRPGVHRFGDWHSGLYFNDGTPKPAAATYATPIFSDCVERSSGRWAFVWGRLRGRGANATAALEARAGEGAWQPVQTFDRPSTRAGAARARAATSDGQAVTRYVRHQAGTAYRLRWTSGSVERTSPASAPASASCGRPKARASRKLRQRRARAAKRAQ